MLYFFKAATNLGVASNILSQISDIVAGIVAEGEWLSGLNSFREVTEVKLGRARSNSGWVTSEAWLHNSPHRPSEGTLN